MTKPVGLFDMDGTLCDYVGTLLRDVRELAAPCEPSYSVTDLFDEDKPWLKARMDLIKRQPGWWRNLPPLQLGMGLFLEASLMGFDVEILTKGPVSKRQAWAEKGEWIDRHLGSEVTVNIVGRGKYAYYGRFLCDDYVPYMLEWLEHRPRGLGLLIATEENTSFTHPNVIRCTKDNKEEAVAAMRAALVRQPKQHWRECL